MSNGAKLWVVPTLGTDASGPTMSQRRYGKLLSLQTNRSRENNGKVPTPTQRRNKAAWTPQPPRDPIQREAPTGGVLPQSFTPTSPGTAG
jgi:hypothetical protein